jgi:hypothetical protein
MLAGWGEIVGAVLLVAAPLIVVLGDRLVVWWASWPRPMASVPSVARFHMSVGLVRGAFVAAVTAGVYLLPPT